MADENDRQAEAREREHTGRIRGLFASIAGRYDLMNRMQSMGRDVAWRRRMACEVALPPGGRCVDVATGSGDVALAIAKAYPDAEVTGVDIVEELMDIARDKARARGMQGRVAFKAGNALALPFEDGRFDASTMAFGIRNIKDRVAALREMRRVVAPGGRVAVLELVYHQRAPLRWFYHAYLKLVIPLMARLFSENPDAYIYLGRSIMDFPSPEGFMALMRDAGITEVRDMPLTFGVAHLFVGKA